MKPFDTLTYRGQLHRLRQLGQAALAEYAVPAPRLHPLRHEANTTFCVLAADQQQYVLRIHRPDGHTPEAVRSEMQWLLALRQGTEIAVPEPVLTRTGSPLALAETPGVPTPRICVLFRWLEGRFINERLTPQHLERIGRLTAQLHEHTAHWQPPADFVRGRVDAITATARRAAWLPVSPTPSHPVVYPAAEDVARLLALVSDHCSRQAAVVVDRTIAQIRAVFHALGDGKTVFGLLHADLHQENYFFHRGEPRLIDFDDCGWGHYLFDLNVTLFEVAQLPAYPLLREALLRGYRSIRPLSAQHEGYLDTFMALRRLQLMCWVIESRDHPAFRAGWAEWARNDVEELECFPAHT
ncbi:MAG: phosphotransferase [Caldilineaceae bacterium]